MQNPELADVTSEPAEKKPVYYCQHTAPCGEHAYRKAVKANRFPCWRVGKRLLARAEDVIAWIESPEHRVTPMRPANAAAEDEIDRALAAGGVARRIGGDQ